MINSTVGQLLVLARIIATYLIDMLWLWKNPLENLNLEGFTVKKSLCSLP